MKLGARMAAISAMVPAGGRVADIGTDHAYLPVYLVSEGIAAYVVAGDIHKGPYQSALGTVENSGLAGRISVRLGDGLSVLKPGEVDTVVIAGMGGASIIEILTIRPEVTGLLSRLVLQPMLAAGAVRRWLVEQGWCLVDETLVAEDGRLYEIIAAEPGRMPELDAISYEIGPLLWERRHPLLADHLKNMIAQSRRIVAEMGASEWAVNSAKYREYQQKIALLEEKYACL